MYHDDMHRAAEHAHAAVASMAKYALPPTPTQYTVWYAYHAGSNGELTAAVDALSKGGARIPLQAVEDLYAKYFSADRRNNQHEMAERLETAIDQVRKLLGNAESNSRAYGDRLERFSGELGDAAAPGGGGLEQTGTDITSLIGAILEETRDMQERNRALESRLAETNAEVAQLRQSFEQVRREALTDMLTGLANRKSFDQSLHQLANAARSAETGRLSLLMIDIDHFKRFNDTHGHQTGDTVLQLVGRMLADNTKGHDVAARYGGEEFAVLLPQTGLEQAEALGEAIRRAIAARKLVKRSSGEDLGQIGISIGVAQLHGKESLEEFVQRADQALYVAKSAGRGRVVADRRFQG